MDKTPQILKVLGDVKPGRKPGGVELYLNNAEYRLLEKRTFSAPILLEALRPFAQQESCIEGFRPARTKPHSKGCAWCQQILAAREAIERFSV